MFMRAWGIGLLLAALALPVAAQVQGRPALEPARIAGEAVVGVYTGIGGYFLGRYIGGAVGDLFPSASEEAKLNISRTAGVTIGGLATAGGVFAVGTVGSKQTASYPITFVGAGAGYLIGIGVSSFFFGPRRLPAGEESSHMRWMEATIEALLPSIGATIAFNSTRRYR